MVPETNTVHLLLLHMRSADKEISIPAMRALSQIFFTENPQVINYALSKNLLHLLC